MSEPHFPVTIYYDGACRVCAAEITHYLRRDRQQRLRGVDIGAPEFDPAPLGLTQAALMHELHVIDSRGTVYRNVHAFVAIWQAFPRFSPYRLLAWLVTRPLVALPARAGYRLFARSRRYLPRRKQCDSGGCRHGQG